MATSIHPPLSCRLLFYTIPIFPLFFIYLYYTKLYTAVLGKTFTYIYMYMYVRDGCLTHACVKLPVSGTVNFPVDSHIPHSVALDFKAWTHAIYPA